jgi:hypothetical protein
MLMDDPGDREITFSLARRALLFSLGLAFTALIAWALPGVWQKSTWKGAVGSLCLLLPAAGTVLALIELVRPRIVLQLDGEGILDKRSRFRIPWSGILRARASDSPYWAGVVPLPRSQVFVELRATAAAAIIGQWTLTEWFLLAFVRYPASTESVGGDVITIDVTGVDIPPGELVRLINKRAKEKGPPERALP